MLRRKKRKHCVPAGKPLGEDSGESGVVLDFVHDAMECGRAIRVLRAWWMRAGGNVWRSKWIRASPAGASRRMTRVLDAIVIDKVRNGMQSLR
jgi:hypothetical protein